MNKKFAHINKFAYLCSVFAKHMQEKYIKIIVIAGIITASMWLIYKIISGFILLNIISNLTI